MATTPEREQAQQKITDEYVKALVDDAPPLSESQRARLGRILRAGLQRHRDRQADAP